MLLKTIVGHDISALFIIIDISVRPHYFHFVLVVCWQEVFS